MSWLDVPGCVSLLEKKVSRTIYSCGCDTYNWLRSLYSCSFSVLLDLQSLTTVVQGTQGTMSAKPQKWLISWKEEMLNSSSPIWREHAQSCLDGRSIFCMFHAGVEVSVVANLYRELHSGICLYACRHLPYFSAWLAPLCILSQCKAQKQHITD